MVERLKAAIEKARQGRETLAAGPSQPAARPSAPAAPRTAPEAWAALQSHIPSAAHLLRHRIVTRDRSRSAHIAFDVLRTRLLRLCGENNWRRIGVTSPTKHCGKSTTCLNLAFSLARQKDRRIVLIDLDLRLPQLHVMLGKPDPGPISSFLSGKADVADAFLRVGDGLAAALNDTRESHSAEVLHDPATLAALKRADDVLQPDLVLVDLPPLLVTDDAMAILPSLDAVMLVIAAGHTTAQQVEECERLISNSAPLLGVVLNKHDDATDSAYDYVAYGTENA